ncbi:Pentatricopeptide repeat [Macleaya cordata]|uniref:Pentatricopeptide repeat n=1 Tax=Macleaya cordata TaxID=56857 RepID=A0A200QAU2_MACCD|nr:Pentatricopeptide repeat [Macleaya cordata]
MCSILAVTSIPIQIQNPHKSKPIWLSTPSYTNLLNQPNLLFLFENCKSIRQLKQIHAHLFTSGLSHNPYALSALFEFSAVSDFRSLNYALKLFDTLNPPTLFSFNTIIRAFSTSRIPDRSVHFFLEMIKQGISPNKYTYPFVLKSLSVESSLLFGNSVHGHAIKMGSSLDSYVHSSLIHFYSMRGALTDARNLFDKSPETNVVCWSAMISGYIQLNQFTDALSLFNEFQIEGLEPNESILVSVLCASAHLGAFEQGRWMHIYVEKFKIPLSVNLGTALINMYCKCGVVEEALKVFDKMRRKNVLSWTALISGLAMNGMGQRALEVFDEMLKTGLRPDSVTFVGVLTACSHGGLVDDALKYFGDMKSKYQIVPKVEHYGCLVDVFSRAGLLNKALDFIQSMPIEPDLAIWGSLLNACSVYKNAEIGEFVGKLLIELDPLSDANYVLLSNIYAHKRRWADAIEIRSLMKERGVKKCPGCSIIEVEGVVYEFFMGEKSDQRFRELKPMLDEMGRRLRSAGYIPTTSQVLLDIDEEEKQEVLCYHSEKLAIAFGLIHTDPAMPIRIVKNLRACVDCHSATKLISKVFNREIIVRDRLRFHHFKSGVCSCTDFW